MIRTIALCVSLLIICNPAAALQSLVPTPYPTMAPGAAPFDPRQSDPGGPQTLVRDPYPQSLGNDSQGNPPISRNHRRQRAVPTIYQRKYRVDRP
jgi:hypothetical protein